MKGDVRGKPLPLDALLRQDRLVLRESSVPLRVVDPGPFAGLLPFALARQEAIALLKHFKYEKLARRGKGSREFWSGPDGRGFPIPRRDPISTGVFRKVLDHFSLTKEEYMTRIRPML